ncbi:T9SS outer membrane translocon Sov/SprA [Arcticibacterium luteifluviistationis]|uniref:Cell surface protein SprA n=1 Tax=Arcticibacterium luteifluviistationis TaxID=1784714 RepID=A0A2Z4GCB5_9BACT|nr:cell surface protein SprA [Arcticibacterium luteifluviistationis]AWV98675.1 cell surface protein SprA [Arcticibacterium luteifluviistationis]
MLKNFTFLIKYLFTLLVILALGNSAFSQQINRSPAAADTSIYNTGTKPAFRWKDSYLDRFNFDLPRSPLFNLYPSALETSVIYEPENDKINVDEKLGDDITAKIPTSMTFNEYSSIQNAMVRKSILRDYERLQDGNSNTSGRGLSPLLKKSPLVDKLFGGKVPEFKPNGFISVDLRAGSQFLNNPETPLYLRKRPIFDFDQQISINFNNNANEGENDLQGGQGGFGGNNQGGGLSELKKLTQSSSALENRDPYREKMGILGNFDTKSAFNFENQFKLNFKSDPEDILQSLEAGNVSFPISSQLIPGVENLFGVKAGLRFGKLNVSTVVAQQRSRTESITISGGAQNRPFEIRSDEYDENRHFFLSHYFRDRYEASLKSLPMVTSQVLITRVEVYVTNRTNSVNSNRNLVGVTDLGETDPYNKAAVSPTGVNVASNKANSLNELLSVEDGDFRQIDNTNTALESRNLKKGVDFEILRGAKRLTDREFDFNQQLGYVSLLTPLRNDEILAVSYEYTINGERYQVGELTEDYSIRKEDDVIMMKLLKSSTIRNKLDHPMWDLMMKNVYSLSQGQIAREGFELRIIYKDDVTGMDVPNLQEGENLKDKPLIAVFGLDKLNYNNDQQYDGNFDYVEGITINESRGTIFFPVLEPFGSYLASQFNDATESTLKQKYVFSELYDKTISDAQQVNTKNKFYIAGSVQSESSEIPLPLGASGASVRVYSGGTELQQGTDYIVDSQIGRIRIVNPSILASGRSIRIDYERPDLFQSQIRRLFGLRLDYSVSKSLRLGATMMDLKESTPGFLTRTSIGNEPVNNTLWGFDVNFKKEGNGFTRLLDKLPLIQTKEPSSIILSAEFAQLIPGVNNKKIDGNAMIDDFEAARNINDLTRQPRKWRLGSTPDKFKDLTVPTYGYNYKRAKMSVYTIDQSTFITSGFGGGNGIVPEEITAAAQNNLYERSFVIQDIFPGRSTPVLGQNLPSAILDVSYFPEERGMYNYNPNLTSDGLLQKPEDNFGAVMRGITFDADFDNSNVEYLEFWLLNPFQDAVRDGRKTDGNTNQTGGVLSIQLGDISEDVIPDSRFNFENGIPTFSETASQPDITNWGKAPTIQFLTDAFDNSTADENSLRKQDVGLDGLSNEEERNFEHIKEYLDKVKINVTNQEALNEIINDPSGDDFKFFLDNGYGTDQFIVERFKNYLGMENNSPSINETDVITPSSSAVADKEDLNQDNTISDVESYWNYDIPLANDGLSVGNGYIIDKVSSGNADWYLFRVPLRSDSTKAQAVGGITGFKSVRFMRMVMSEWKEPVVLRFAALQLVSNSYRAYTEDLNNNSFVTIPEPNSNTTGFKVSTVSIEENGCTEDGDCNIKDGQTPYVVPPGFQRDRDFSQQTFRQFNEQSVSLAVEALEPGDKRAIFKNTDLDLNMYKRVQMFVHAENEQNQDNYAGAFMRLGTDSKTNYYEVEIENLKATPIGSTIPEDVWPAINDFDIPIDEFRNLKVRRNSKLGSDPDVALDKPYWEYVTVNSLPTDAGEIIPRTYKITVVGNPDLSNVLVTMLGISNPLDSNKIEQPAKFTVWMNELRANGFDDTKGEAAVLAADIKLADIGTISVSANINTFGFGGVQDRISSRSQETSQGFGIASSLELDKFFPQSWGLSIPLFMNYDIQEVVPYFDPLDPDIVLDNALAQFSEAEAKAYKDLVIDRNVNKGFNLSNVRKTKTDPNAKSHIYDVENFSVSYAQSSISRSNILIDEYLAERKTGALTYQFQPKTTLWEPFKEKESLANPKLAWLKALNFSPIPNLIAFRTDFNRSFTKTAYRSAEQTDSPGEVLPKLDPNYIKYFLTNRYYDLQWDLTKSISMTYNAQMNSIIDEEYGDAQESIWQGIFSSGRAKNYSQGLQLTYKLPLDKFFLLDWINANSRFNTDYQYRANSFDYANNESLADINGDSYGNFIENGRELAIQGRIDLVKLYNKLKYLKFANSPNQPRERFTRAPGDDEEIVLPTSDILKTFTRLLMTVRGINFNYSIVETTILPGFLPSVNLMGLSNMNSAPGLPFALLGSQNRTIHNTAGTAGWLSKSAVRNDPFTQTRQKKFDFSTNLEPFKGFRMQIRGNYSKGDSYQEIYRPKEAGEDFEALNPFRNGTFSMSFWSFKTGFTKMSKDPEDNYKYDIFDKMVAYRDSVIIKLQDLNTSGETGKWDQNSQDVLIPAFFAAYSGKDIDKLFEKVTKKGRSTFNPFLQFPMPNWRIDYTGLEKLPLFNKVFSSITLSHSYSSTYSVGNFTSSLLYDNENGIIGLDNNEYTLGNSLSPYNYFSPVFIMSSITMEERFSPLIGIQFTTKANISGRLDFNRERRAALNLANAQVAEYNSNDVVMGFGFKKNNVKLPFKGRDGNNIILTNDLNFRFDVTIRDVTSLQRRLDGDAVPIQGNYNLQIKPQVQYQFNKKLSMGFYFERFVNKPFTSLSYETRRTVGGLNMKFNLAD